MSLLSKLFGARPEVIPTHIETRDDFARCGDPGDGSAFLRFAFSTKQLVRRPVLAFDAAGLAGRWSDSDLNEMKISRAVQQRA